MQVSLEAVFASFLHEKLHLDLSGFTVLSPGAPLTADAAISIGGDGTFLGTAAKVGEAGIPILGINTGRLGFLADVSPEAICPSLEALCRGDYVVEKRRALQVEKIGVESDFFPFALNEVAVLKHDNSSLIEISTYIDNEYLTTYLADGLIVSTPTGSTAYSLSNGGPIIVPQTSTLCLTPVAPHSLNIRPIVLGDDSVVTLTVESRSHNFLIAIDGRSEKLTEATTLTIRKAPFTINIVKRNGRRYFASLREKMMWGVDGRK